MADKSTVGNTTGGTADIDVMTDEVTDATIGTAKVQYVKIMDGTLDSSTKVGATADGLKVDGSAVTQPVSDGGGSLTVDGTVTVQDGGGTLSVDDGGSTVSVDDGGGSITVDGSVTATLASTTITANVAPVGSSSFATDQLAPTSTATSATIASRNTRTRIILYNTGSGTLYVSDRATNAGTPATTTAKSFQLLPGATCEMKVTSALYIFTASGTGALHYWEEYS